MKLLFAIVLAVVILAMLPPKKTIATVGDPKNAVIGRDSILQVDSIPSIDDIYAIKSNLQEKTKAVSIACEVVSCKIQDINEQQEELISFKNKDPADSTQVTDTTNIKTKKRSWVRKGLEKAGLLPSYHY